MINVTRYDDIVSKYGGSGTAGDRLRMFYSGNGTLAQQEREWLVSCGAKGNSIGELWRSYLSSYTGTLNDKLSVFVSTSVTNSALWSREIDSAHNPIWGQQATTTAYTAVGIDGIPNTASVLTGTNAGAEDFLQQVFTVANDTSTNTFSVFVGKTSGSSVFPGLMLEYSGGTASYAGVIINTDTGTLVDRPSYAPDDKNIESFDSNFWRVWIADANNGSGNTTMTVKCLPSISDGASWDATLTGSNTFDGAQVEIGASQAGIFVFTESAAVTL